MGCELVGQRRLADGKSTGVGFFGERGIFSRFDGDAAMVLCDVDQKTEGGKFDASDCDTRRIREPLMLKQYRQLSRNTIILSASVGLVLTAYFAWSPLVALHLRDLGASEFEVGVG